MFQPAKKQKLSEIVANQIIDSIRNGIYKNGEMLPSEKDLIRIYKVSRVTIREALRILAEKGIIVKKQGRGSFVAVEQDDVRVSTLQTGTADELWEIYHYSMEIRSIIEPMVAKKIAEKKPGEKELKAVMEVYEKMNGASQENLICEFTPDEQFHLEIIRLMDNPVLTDWMMQLQSLENTTHKVRLPKLENQEGFVAQNQERHTQIIEAIKNGDGEAAYFYMKQHLRELSEQFENYFLGLKK